MDPHYRTPSIPQWSEYNLRHWANLVTSIASCGGTQKPHIETQPILPAYYYHEYALSSPRQAFIQQTASLAEPKTCVAIFTIDPALRHSDETGFLDK